MDNLGTYNQNKNLLTFHLNELKKCVIQVMPNYDNFVLLYDFNSEGNEPVMQEFLDPFDMKNLAKFNMH